MNLRTASVSVVALFAACSSNPSSPGTSDGTYQMTVQQVRGFCGAARPVGYGSAGGGTTFTLQISGDTVSIPGSFSCSGTWAEENVNPAGHGTDLTCTVTNGASATGCATGAVPASLANAQLTVRIAGAVPNQADGSDLSTPALATDEVALWMNYPTDFIATGTP